jgi:hypothetical protein
VSLWPGFEGIAHPLIGMHPKTITHRHDLIMTQCP